MWNMEGLQLAPRSASELQPVLMNTVFRRFATWPIASPDADEISPMIIATLSRSIRRSALAEAVCGLTESSITSSILRPITPPASLISSAASFTPMTAYSPSGPRKPVSGVRCPMRMASVCARTIAGMPTPASTAEPTARLMSVRRDRLEFMAIPPFEQRSAGCAACGRSRPSALAAILRQSLRPPGTGVFALLATKCMYHSRSCGVATAKRWPMTEKIDIKLNINGHDYAVRAEPRKTLVDVIRDECGLTGTHIGCEHGICGACTVILDNEAVRSCLMFAVQAQGKRIRTVEGLADGDKLHPLQSAFIDHHALQCGFCTPGFLMLAVNALETNPDLTDEDILDLLSSNLCRCTGYQNIVKAVRSTAAEMRRQAVR